MDLVFTGIVEEKGTVLAREAGRLTVGAVKVIDGASVGDSIALNGCCLTIASIGEGFWSADVVEETFRRTTLGGLSVGDQVNLERPCQPTGRLGGHIVQGHVDAVGTVQRLSPFFVVSFPGALSKYVVEKGSIAIDGVSLTVAGIVKPEPGSDAEAEVSIALIPHTAEATVLGMRQGGDQVNIEVDVVAKYVESLLAAHQPVDALVTGGS
jgi:riboflavin synthase